MFDANFIDKLFTNSINAMTTSDWKWPEDWDFLRKQRFLKACREYAEKKELYEQCAIIRDVEKELTED